MQVGYTAGIHRFKKFLLSILNNCKAEGGNSTGYHSDDHGGAVAGMIAGGTYGNTTCESSIGNVGNADLSPNGYGKDIGDNGGSAKGKKNVDYRMRDSFHGNKSGTETRPEYP